MAKMQVGRVTLVAPAEHHAHLRTAVEEVGLEARMVTSTADALSSLCDFGPCAIVVAEQVPERSRLNQLVALRKGGASKQVFVIVLSDIAAQDVCLRLACFDAGANMVTSSLQAATTALRQVTDVLRNTGPYNCPKCGLEKLSENSLHLHMHMHHAAEDNPEGECPICQKDPRNLAVHIHNEHGPVEHREPPPAHFGCFAWCVCRRPTDGRFLMVNEPAGISGGRPGYWLPAGRVDIGETLVEACRREALEEAGVAVRVTGVLRFMVDRRGTIRVVFLAEPEQPDAEPKSIPDWESVGALWVDVRDLEQLKHDDYRSPDPAVLFPMVAQEELKPHSLETKAFKELEALIVLLTAGHATAQAQLPEVWAQVEAAYPPSAFKRS